MKVYEIGFNYLSMFCCSMHRINNVRMIAEGDIGNSGGKEHRSSSKTAFIILVEAVIPFWPSFIN